LLPVEVVPGGGVGVEGVLVVVGVDEVGVVGVVTVEVGVVTVEVEVVWVTVGVLVVVGVDFGVVVGAGWAGAPQSLRASVRTVAAPRLRSETKVGLTEPGRAGIWVWMFPINRSALTQFWFAMSAEAAFSCEVSELASLGESSPELEPQAVRNATASPSPPARRARGA
jgi:hypothetical protein